MTENNVPKVYAAIHQVLKALQVEKNGELPSNMGGKNYATAEAVSNGVKNLFVENNLILEANETVSHVDTPDFGDKKTRFSIVITGSYRAIHIEDGSSISFSGTGSGLATGTAISANIASTFALKNALQRQFLISEDSVEREGQTEQAAPKQTPAQRTATQAATPPAPKKATGKANQDAQLRIKEKMSTAEEGTPYHNSNVAKMMDALAKQLDKPKGEVMVELEQRLEAGEVV